MTITEILTRHRMDGETSRWIVVNETIQEIELRTDSLQEAKDYIRKHVSQGHYDLVDNSWEDGVWCSERDDIEELNLIRE